MGVIRVQGWGIKCVSVLLCVCVIVCACVCVCVLVCVRAWGHGVVLFVRACLCVGACECICVCVCYRKILGSAHSIGASF
jgi:hypothetical protein